MPVRHRLRGRLRRGVAEARQPGGHPGQVRLRPVHGGPQLHRAGHGGEHRRGRREGEHPVAGRDVPHPDLRRAVAEPRRPVRHRQARPCRVQGPDARRLVPRRRVGKQAGRRPGQRLLGTRPRRPCTVLPAPGGDGGCRDAGAHRARAVGEAAMAMVEEVRRQFRTIPGIMEGKGKPEYEKCVAISTNASIKKMMAPGAIALLSPVIIGFIFGPQVLGGFLAGATVSGVLMGIFQNNAGGAWDNAKKSFEKGVEINGQIYYKKSEPHKASVTGDTVGDPFKDTSGPSMNILIKLMSIVSLVIAPTLAQIYGNKAVEVDTVKKEVKKVQPVAKTITSDKTVAYRN